METDPLTVNIVLTITPPTPPLTLYDLHHDDEPFYNPGLGVDEPLFPASSMLELDLAQSSWFNIDVVEPVASTSRLPPAVGGVDGELCSSFEPEDKMDVVDDGLVEEMKVASSNGAGSFEPSESNLTSASGLSATSIVENSHFASGQM